MLASAMSGAPVAWGELPNDEAFLDEAWARIQFHGIAATLQPHIAQNADWPPSLIERVREETRLIGLWEETHRTCVAELIDIFSSERIESVAMKGTALAYSHYEDPSYRRRGDTDLLIQPGDLRAAREVLARGGWIKRESPQGLVFQETWIFDTRANFIHELDLHWRPNDRPILQTVLRNDEFFGSARALPRLSEAAKAPSPIMTLIQVALNQAWHRSRGFAVGDVKVVGGNRLIWARDCDLLARSFSSEEWSMLVQVCVDRHIGPIVERALAAAHQAFDTPLPAEAMSNLGKTPLDQAILRYLTYPDLIQEFKADLRSLPTLRAKAHLIRANAWSDRAHLEAKYPDKAHWPTFALQLRRMAHSLGRLAKKGFQE